MPDPTHRSLLGHSGICEACNVFGYVVVGAGLPQLCDGCNTRRKVRAAFAEHPGLARQIYGAATADDALRLLGVAP